MKNTFILLATALLLFSFNSPDKSEEFDFGRFSGDKYSNKYFGINLDLPSDWYKQSQEETKRLAQLGMELISDDDDVLKKLLKASEVRIAHLFMLYKNEPGAPVDFNASMILLSENVKHAPGIKKGDDYLFHARKLLANSAIDYDSITEEFEKLELGGKDFYVMEASKKLNNTSISQLYITTILDGFALGFVLSYDNDLDKMEMMNSIKTIEFK